jgi:hypothetical protein
MALTYPQPRTCVHDRGPEFVAHEFQTMLEDTGISLRPTSARNPQSNGIIEQVHPTIAAIIRIIVNSLSPIDTVKKANNIVQDALHKAMHMVRCASHNSFISNPNNGFFSIANGQNDLRAKV